MAEPPPLQQINLQGAELKEFLENEHKNTGLRGMDSFWNYIKSHYHGIPRVAVRQVVHDNPILQRHQRVTKRKNVNVIVGKTPNQHWQMDITEVKMPQHFYLVCVVDIFSRYAWVRRYQHKTAHNVVAMLRAIFQAGQQPRILQSDNGAEFKNNAVEALLNEFGVKHIFSSTYHATAQSYVERFNQSIKGMVTRNISAQTGHNLAQIVRLYNETVHSTTGVTPHQLHFGEVGEEKKQQIVADKQRSASKTLQLSHDDSKLNEGDIVRIALRSHEDRKLNKDPFRKGYKFNWSQPTYTIVRKITPALRNGVRKPIYYNIDEFGTKKFYSHDLLKV